MTYDKDLEKYLKEYQENPYSRVFAPLAEAYRKSGMTQEAVDIAKEGIKHHPDFVSGKVSLARSYIDLKKHDEACNILEEITESAPNNYMAQKLLADTYKELGNFDEAMRVYTYILSENPHDTDIADKITDLEEKIRFTEKGESENTNEQQENSKIDANSFNDAYDNLNSDEPPDFDIPQHPHDLIPEFSPPSFEISDSSDFETKKTEEIFKTDDETDDAVVTELASETMAELLEEQGYKNKALDVYKELLAKDPKNENLISKITDLELELGIVKIQEEEIEMSQAEQDNNNDDEDEILKYAYDEEAPNITVIPPPFDVAEINEETDDFENKKLDDITQKKEEINNKKEYNTLETLDEDLKENNTATHIEETAKEENEQKEEDVEKDTTSEIIGHADTIDNNEEKEDIRIMNSVSEEALKEEPEEKKDNNLISTIEQKQVSEEQSSETSFKTEKLNLKVPKLSSDIELEKKEVNQEEWLIPNKKLYKLEQILEKIQKKINK